MELTAKQEAYCQYYVMTGSQSGAYRLAYDADSMNQNSVAREACLLHADPNITQRIKEIKQDIWDRNKITIDELIQSLAGMVRFDIGELYDDDGKLLPLKKMPLSARQMISQLDTDEIIVEQTVIGNTRKVRTYSKTDAIEKLMKHLGGYERDNSQKQTVIMPTVDLSKLSLSALEELANASKTEE